MWLTLLLSFLSLPLFLPLALSREVTLTHPTTNHPNYYNPQCVHKGGQTKSTLKEFFQSYGQTTLSVIVPRKLESHYNFAEVHERDPFLWGFVRPSEDYGHDQIFSAIIRSWFEIESDGFLEIDLSAEPSTGEKKELQDSAIDNFKELITEQLRRCPESIILLRRSELTPGAGVAILADFFHDVAEFSTGIPVTPVVRGNRAIFIVEIVVRELKEERLMPLLREGAEGAVSDGRGSLGGIRHALLLQSAIVKEYFGNWRAFGTRLWVSWISELSQGTKLRLYQERVKTVRDRYQAKGYFINYEPQQQQLHCDNLSPPSKGIKRLVEFFEKDEIKGVMGKCPEGEKHIKWMTEGTNIVCLALFS